jgi:hypothetical protein
MCFDMLESPPPYAVKLCAISPTYGLLFHKFSLPSKHSCHHGFKMSPAKRAKENEIVNDH